MPGNHIRIFLSSPSDLQFEREKMAELIAETNDVLTYLAPEHGLKLELLRYEVDAYPDYGAPQDVINRLLPDDFEIFIGLMWRRCGTPTGEHKSGTIAEYRRAVERRRRSGKPIIMFYFRDAAIPFPTKEDIAQLENVVEFRSEMQRSGLTQTYPSPETFREYVRGDLLAAVRDLITAGRSANIADNRIPPLAPVTDAEEKSMRALCVEYDQLRATMKAGANRTSLMTATFSKMRSHAASVVSSLAAFKAGQTAGERLAAVAILQMFPSAKELDWLAERLDPEVERPFFGFQAAQALLTAVRSLPSQDCSALRKAVQNALNLAELNPHDPPRIYALRSAIELLSRKCS